MSKWIWVGMGALAVVVAAGAYRHQGQKAEREAAKRAAIAPAANPMAPPQSLSTQPSTPPPPAVGKPPPGEPPEDVLVKFMQQEYDEINRQGGMPVTATASGKSTVLKPKLYSARKLDCTPVPQQPEGSWECSLDMMVTLREGDTKPGKHSERLFLHWDGTSGEWTRGLASAKRKKG